MNEPITDHMRAILDGHIVLTRELASRGHHPSIDLLQSTSRLMSHLATAQERELAAEVRRLLAVFEASRDLVELGAHQPGVNPILDRAVELKPALDQVFIQTPSVSVARAQACSQLAAAMASSGAAA